MNVKIYVEGGGDSNATRTACRRGFVTFIGRMLPGKACPSVVSCGGRSQTFEGYKRALKQGEIALILVDSEAPVEPGVRPWVHLKNRDGDRWEQPEDASDDDAHLMVQCMEAWFIADPETLAIYYKKGFNAARLPRLVNGDGEVVPKAKIEAGLASATRRTSAKKYHKTRDGFRILECIDPIKVCAASGHARRLREILEKLLPAR